jgi:hypothetical protein
MGKNHDSDPGSVMNISDQISESLETIFGLKILKFLDADLFEPRFRIRDG